MNRTALRTACLLAATAATAATGCAGLKGSAEGFAVRGPRGSVGAEGRILSRSLGRVNVLSFMEVLDSVLVREHGLTIKRRAERLDAADYETDWAPRSPSAEEAAAGITDTRHRVVLQGHRLDSSTASDSVVVFRMNLTVENEVRTEREPEWHPGRALDEAFLERVSSWERDLRAAAREALGG